MDDETSLFDTTAISFHTLSGASLPRALKFCREINHKQVTILVDSVSTYNFIQPTMVKYLDLTIFSTPKFQVMTGNGQHLECEGKCINVSLNV